MKDRLPLQPNWLTRAVVAGFCSTIMMILALIPAYALSVVLSKINLADRSGALGSASTVEGWFRGLTQNHVVDLFQGELYGAIAMHMVVGLFFAVLYARWFEPRLKGSAVEKGMLFSLIPWLLSLVFFLPFVGGGVFGAALNAGPLPVIGNLVLHLIYGATLGLVYGPFGDVLVEDVPDAVERNQEHEMMHLAEGTAAKGILIGLLVGFGIGLGGFAFGAMAHTGVILGLSPAWFMLSCAMMGGALGAIVGSVVGLPTRAPISNRM